jgi:hypothetical protein
LNIDFELTLEDMLDFNLYVLTHQDPFKRNIRFSKIFNICAMVFCALMGVYHLFFSKDIVIAIISFAFVLFLIAFYWFLFSPQNYRNRVRKAVVKQYSKIPNAELCRHKISISEEGLRESSEFGEGIQNWSTIESIVQTDRYIYLFLSTAKGFIVPRRAFSDDASFNLFAEESRNFKAGKK